MDERGGASAAPQRPGGHVQGAGRIVFLDAARAAAIALALWFHCLGALHGWRYMDRLTEAAARFSLLSVTPLFLVLFGLTLEVIVVPRFASGSRATLSARFRRRSWECYLGYAAAAVSSIVGGVRTVAEGMLALAFLGEARFGNILKFYALEMLLAVPLLTLRRRIGLTGMVVWACGLWTLVPVVDLVAWDTLPASPANLSALFVGRPVLESPPSLLHAQILVVAGMLMGHAVTRDIGGVRWLALLRVMGLLALVAVGVLAIVLVVDLGPRELIREHIGRRLRSANHPAYFAFSILQVGAILLPLSIWLSPRAHAGRVLHGVLVLGRWPIASYSLGNAILNVTSPRVSAGPIATALLVAAFPVLIATLMGAYERRAVPALAYST